VGPALHRQSADQAIYLQACRATIQLAGSQSFIPWASPCLARVAASYYTAVMKTLTVRLPDALAAEVQAESRRRKLSKSDVVRERLSAVARFPSRPAALDAIADLIGSVGALPADLSKRRKHYLKATGYGRKRTG
jgi:Arc/MetJ-type ribon-helix-helix transcriptional regulator